MCTQIYICFFFNDEALHVDDGKVGIYRLNNILRGGVRSTATSAHCS
jgi:hypothetical protein